MCKSENLPMCRIQESKMYEQPCPRRAGALLCKRYPVCYEILSLRSLLLVRDTRV